MLKKFFLNETFIFILILLNAVTLFLQCMHESSRLLLFFDTGFLFCFLIEMFFRLREMGWRGYWSDSWSRFDGTVTLLSSLSLLHFFAFLGFPISLESLILLRVFRVFRFFRILRFIPAMDSIIRGTKRAIQSSYVIVLAFLVIAFIVSLISCTLYRQTSPEYFENPIRSFYTIFRIFTIEGWYEIPNSIAASCEDGICGAATKIYFTFLLFVGGIIGMSFINSIIVDAMVSDNTEALESKISTLETKIDHLTRLLLLSENSLKAFQERFPAAQEDEGDRNDPEDLEPEGAAVDPSVLIHSGDTREQRETVLPRSSETADTSVGEIDGLAPADSSTKRNT